MPYKLNLSCGSRGLVEDNFEVKPVFRICDCTQHSPLILQQVAGEYGDDGTSTHVLKLKHVFEDFPLE